MPAHAKARLAGGVGGAGGVPVSLEKASVGRVIDDLAFSIEAATSGDWLYKLFIA
jgi:hypothetical protein